MKTQLVRIGVPAMAVLASVGIGFAGVSSAQSATSSDQTSGVHERGMRGERPAVFGTVTAVNGSIITVESKMPRESSDSGTSYTIDASSATVKKAAEGSAPADSSVSAIAVGDTVMVRGTVSGTSVTASEIVDGAMHGGPGMGGRGHGTRGTVTAVSGNTITLTGSNGTTYTVDASSASLGKVSKITVGDVQVGDTLNVSGDVSGTSISAKRIMDGESDDGAPPQE